MTFNLSYAPFDVDKFLNDTLEAATRSSAWNPACNTYEDEQGFWVQAALPGLDRKDIGIVFDDKNACHRLCPILSIDRCSNY